MIDTVLQIWLNGKPPERLRRKMRSVWKAYDHAYILMTDPHCLIGCEDYMDIYNSLSRWDHKSDLLRFFYLSKFPDTLYCDCDVELTGRLKLEDRLSFASISNVYDHFIVYNAKDTDKCKEIFDEAMEIGRRAMNNGSKLHKSWFHVLIQHGDYGKITKGYKHG